MFAGIIASLLIWIDNYQRPRNSVHPRQVMVRNDQIDSATPCGFDGGEGADACVNADDQPHALGSGALNHLVAHAIAFANAMRHMKVSRSAAKFDGRLENHD